MYRGNHACRVSSRDGTLREDAYVIIFFLHLFVEQREKLIDDRRVASVRRAAVFPRGTDGSHGQMLSIVSLFCFTRASSRLEQPIVRGSGPIGAQ